MLYNYLIHEFNLGIINVNTENSIFSAQVDETNKMIRNITTRADVDSEYNKPKNESTVVLINSKGTSKSTLNNGSSSTPISSSRT